MQHELYEYDEGAEERLVWAKKAMWKELSAAEEM